MSKEPLLIKDVYYKNGIVAIRGATWEFKNIDRSVFQSQFDNNPTKAERDLGANPPKTSGGAIPNPDIIDVLANYDRPDPVDHKLNIYGWSVPPIFEWFVGDERFRYYLHFDLSKSGDQTGCGMVHYDFDRAVYVVDLIMTIPVSQNWNLKFQSIDNIVDLLQMQGFNMARVTFDGWQSLHIIQNMEKRGIQSMVYSVDRGTEAYDTLISTTFKRQLDYYPQKVFVKEFKEIQLIGNKYDHGPNGSKDTSDAVAGALANCMKDTLKTEFKHRDLETMFSLDYNLKDCFTYDEDSKFRWLMQPFLKGFRHSLFIDSFESELIVVHGYSYETKFYVDFVDSLQILDEEDLKYLLHLIHNFQVEFVSSGMNTSFKVIDTLRQQRVQIISSDMNMMDSIRSKGIRIIRTQGREAVSSFISQVKQDNVRIVREQRVFSNVSEMNLTNYMDKPFAYAIAMWLHYTIQNKRSDIVEGPRPIMSGSHGLSSSITQNSNKPLDGSGFQNTIGTRPKPRLR